MPFLNNFPLSWYHFLIVCPLVFLAGFVDAIGGGGGLISLPAYLIAGLPTHMAIATNKLSSACGTTVATVRFIKQKYINWKLAVPSIVTALVGSTIGANLSLLADESILRYILVGVLPAVAFVVLNKKLFPTSEEERELVLNVRTFVTVCLSALIIGMYDGFYGPGTGTFLIISFTVIAKMSVRQANGQAKVINLSTNLASLAVFLFSGNVIVFLGLAAAVCNMGGAYLGSGLAIKKGTRIVRPIIIVVLVLLLAKIIYEWIGKA